MFPLGSCRRDLFPNFWTKIEEGRITVGRVELFIQERGAKTRRVVHDYPTDQIPKVGEKVSFRGRNFRVMEIRDDLLVRHGKKALRGVLLIVEDLDALSW